MHVGKSDNERHCYSHISREFYFPNRYGGRQETGNSLIGNSFVWQIPLQMKYDLCLESINTHLFSTRKLFFVQDSRKTLSFCSDL